MTATDLIVEKQQLERTQLIESKVSADGLEPGQVMLTVDEFALTSNNLSYAAAGEMLGYWNFFPTDDPAWGCIPVWGFATVSASRSDSIQTGERIFGFLPMARHLVVEPHSVTDSEFSDRFGPRAALHPWYNRYYRVAADPVSLTDHHDLQPVLWALFMTGWMLARQFGENDDFGADQIIVSSASSKTAYSFAHAFGTTGGGAKVIGLTSSANAAFVEQLGCYDEVRTYDNLGLDSPTGTAAFVDIAGNASVVRRVHEAFGDRLVQSVAIGATHRDARGDTSAMPGSAPRFFFIPDVAEERAGVIGQAEYHAEFAAAWDPFAAWASTFTTVTRASGPEAIEAAYLSALGGSHDPSTGTMLSY